MHYAASIPTGEKFFRFFDLLLNWRGSVYKLVWRDLIVYLLAYYIVNFTYRFGLNEEQMVRFEDLVLFVNKWRGKTVPITFLLGFFVSQILFRWWRMFDAIPLMNYAAFNLNGLILTTSDPVLARRIRLTIMRYLNLSWILALRRISTLIQFRFPCLRLTDDRSGRCLTKEQALLLLDEELELMNKDKVLRIYFPKMITKSEKNTLVALAAEDPVNHIVNWWIPIQWAMRLAKKAVKHGFIENERNYLAMVTMIDRFQNQLHRLSVLSKFNLPLVYSQVVIIAVYSFFSLHMFSNQFIIKSNAIRRKLEPEFLFDYYFPFIAVIEFVFIMGWFKVALVLLNPLGNDDEDFPTSDMLDYNIRLSRAIAGNDCELFPEKLREKRNDLGVDTNLTAEIEYLDSAEEEEDNGFQNDSQKRFVQFGVTVT